MAHIFEYIIAITNGITTVCRHKLVSTTIMDTLILGHAVIHSTALCPVYARLGFNFTIKLTTEGIIEVASTSPSTYATAAIINDEEDAM